MKTLDRGSAWQAIEALPAARLTELFASDPMRVERLTRSLAGISFDWSKTHLDEATITAFLSASERAGRLLSREEWESDQVSLFWKSDTD